jgi:hypothetical protein
MNISIISPYSKIGNMTNKCLNCNNELKQIEGKKQRQFCGDACRMSYKRGKSEQVKSEQIKSEQLNSSISEQTTPEQRKVIEGYCHGCGRRIVDIKEQWVNGVGNEEDAKNICICLPCIQKGITHKSLGLDVKKCDPDYIEQKKRKKEKGQKFNIKTGIYENI